MINTAVNVLIWPETNIIWFGRLFSKYIDNVVPISETFKIFRYQKETLIVPVQVITSSQFIFCKIEQKKQQRKDKDIDHYNSKSESVMILASNTFSFS